MTEFSLIEQFFKSISINGEHVDFGIGDDAACINVPVGKSLLVSTDTLVSGVHFLPEWDAYDIACKATMVNISDIAAMAAIPYWATLALTLPNLDEQWLQRFSNGLKNSLNQFSVDLIGGDTTRGPLSITITIMGLVTQGQAVRRSGAKPGDIIFVSGYLGAAALAVKLLNHQKRSTEDKDLLMNKLLHPKPRIDLAHLLQQFASSAIDISDGLGADLDHICKASGVGALLDKKSIPLHPLLDKYCGIQGIDLALSGGDDYELCFTVPEHKIDSFMKALSKENLLCYPIGVIEDTPGLRVRIHEDCVEELKPIGYSHF